MSEPPKMLPCPFCASTELNHLWYPDEETYFIVCRGCGSQTNEYNIENEAIDAWNRRVEPEKPKWNSETPGEPGQYWCFCDVFHKPAITLIVRHNDNLWVFSQGLGKDGSERLSSFCEKWQNYKLRWLAVEYPPVLE